VKCEIDVTSAMNSINGVIDVVLKVVHKCGSLGTHDKKCGFAASALTQAVLELSASAGKVTESCVPGAPAPVAAADPCATVAVPAAPAGPCDVQSNATRRLTSLPVNTAMCVVDVKDTFKSLMKGIHSLEHIKKECKHGGKKCARNALKVIAAFGGLGQYISGAIGDCAQADFGGKFGETTNGNANGLADLNLAVTPECASGIAGLVKSLAKVSKAAVDLSIVCVNKKPIALHRAAPLDVKVDVEVPHAPATFSTWGTRLYDEEDDKDTTSSSTNFVLGAFLPVTALVSFVGGRFYANRRVVGFEHVRQVVTELE